MVDTYAWTLFLKLEDAVIYRDTRIQEELVSWAFKAGVRAAKPRKSGPR